MRLFLLLLIILSMTSAQASHYQTESFEWAHIRGWATFDQELRVHYRFLPMTEKSHDQLGVLDRRFNYQCQVKERNLRNLFQSETVVIAIYDLKSCVKTGRNPNWKDHFTKRSD
jgi:hypothetical protein